MVKVSPEASVNAILVLLTTTEETETAEPETSTSMPPTSNTALVVIDTSPAVAKASVGAQSAAIERTVNNFFIGVAFSWIIWERDH